MSHEGAGQSLKDNPGQSTETVSGVVHCDVFSVQVMIVGRSFSRGDPAFAVNVCSRATKTPLAAAALPSNDRSADKPREEHPGVPTYLPPRSPALL